MFKKIIAFICALIIVPVMPTAIEAKSDIETERKIQILQSLGLWAGDSANAENFIFSLAGFLYEEPKKLGSAEEVARLTGMIDKYEEYDGKGSLLINDAARYAVVTLGYKMVAEQRGGYPDGYTVMASELGITNGLGLKSNRVTKEAMAKILYQMLDVSPLSILYNGEFAVDGGETLLSKNRDIYELTGLMKANSMTSIYGEDGTGKASVIVDDGEYIAEKVAADAFIGLNIFGYVQENENGEYELLYIEEKAKKNDVIEIKDEDILAVASNFSYIDYYEDETKRKRAEITAVPRVIYNGVYYGQYTALDLMPDIGYIKLIDNNTDGTYDVIIVKSYQTVIVSAVSATEGVIQNRYSFSEALPVVDLELETDNVKYTVMAGDKAVSLSDIEVNSVLSVAMSKNTTNKVAEILISHAAEMPGRITATNPGERELEIDGVVYGYSADFERYLQDTSKQLKLGESYVFYIDAFGRIAFVKNLSGAGYNLFFKVRVDDNEENYYVEYMDLNEEWYKLPMAKKIKIDGQQYSDYAAYTELDGIDPQMVILNVNAKGEVKSIERALTSTGHMEERFTKTAVENLIYRAHPNSLGMKYYLEDDTKTMIFPKTNKMDKSEYYMVETTEYLRSDKYYDVMVYDMDSFGFSGLISITASETTNESKSYFIVRFITQILNDEEVVPAIKGASAIYENITLPGISDTVFAGLNRGDIIQINTNRAGKVIKAKPVLSLSNFAKYDPGHYYDADTVNVAGTVKEIDIANGRIKVDCGSEVSFRISASKGIVKYYPSTNTCELKTAAVLMPGDKIVMCVGSGAINDLICLGE